MAIKEDLPLGLTRRNPRRPFGNFLSKEIRKEPAGLHNVDEKRIIDNSYSFLEPVAM